MSAQRYEPTGFQMIRSIDVRNFRCYQHLEMTDCARLNVIVGDNGVGKTTILESIFMPLSASPEIAVRLRQQRGLEGTFMGSPQQIENALFGDLFFNSDTKSPISLRLSGDGEENRSLTISKGTPTLALGLAAPSGGVPLVFTWTDSNEISRQSVPTFGPTGIMLPATGEDLPDFFHYAAGMSANSTELASRFSDLSREGLHEDFVRIFAEEYHWVENLNVEVLGGAPVLFAKVRGTSKKVPLPSVSGGINRVVGFMLSIASRPRSIATIDEIEGGIYYKHHEAIWSGLLRSLRRFDGQAFVTTHSLECLEALVRAAGDDVDDIALWRIERGDGTQPVVRQFDGKQIRASLDYGGEIR